MSDQDPEIHPEDAQKPQSFIASIMAKQKQRNWLFFALGFLGWYLINGIIWWALYQGARDYVLFNGLLTLPGNLLVLLVLAVIKRTRWISFGMLAAISLNLLISLILGLISQAVCLVPFFLR